MFTIVRAGPLSAIVGLLILRTAIAGTRTSAAQGGPAAGTPTALSTPVALSFPADISGLPAYTVQPLTSAELYDPKTGRFRPTGGMTGPTRDFTATLLENGKVLITGGENEAVHTRLAGAELYDPGTGKFSATGRMHLARQHHTATLLTDGRVLIAGGWSVYDQSFPRYEGALQSANRKVHRDRRADRSARLGRRRPASRWESADSWRLQRRKLFCSLQEGGTLRP